MDLRILGIEVSIHHVNPPGNLWPNRRYIVYYYNEYCGSRDNPSSQAYSQVS